ncbi:hypothetical protein [Parapusillimonas granuli]|uniref:Uncharacterized protein n=1 Tax=Parapusillimonas granuli TaxID=380911 RepID=A0A853FW44_9BURK|nr:hypothetical protein [Parapusillimonas granuli]MBB5213539.1 hypothetical protein [Parapusillimonas granuli]NYT48377.1 hypothetical protein [Parapusillimonas granuli]
MTTKRSKRWNGDLDSLSPDFLKEVLEKMQSYGDRIQFELPNKAARPNYQVIGPTDRKMAFDDRHLILRLNENGNVGDELTPVYSLETIRAAMLGAGKPARAARTARGAARRVASAGPARDTDDDAGLSDLERLTGVSMRRSAAAAPAADVDAIEREKYAYYKANRDAFPDGITKYSQEISALMRAGVPVEDAFEQVIKENFQF